MTLKITADENMPGLDALFGEHHITRVNGRQLSAEQLIETDVLLVRSVTQVNEALLQKAKRLKWVGTATIGVDHLDQSYLTASGIPFTNAPGCNAEGVVDYVIGVIYGVLPERTSLADMTVGVIGAGNVGGRLIKRLQSFGCTVLINDPPKADADNLCFEHSDLDVLLSTADIICCHTPLTTEGAYPTHHLLNEERLSLLKQGALLINAGRGPVIKETALQDFMNQRPDVQVCLDVWEHEPRVDKQLAERVQFATPHIAGYSLEGKIRGSYMLRESMSDVFGLSKPKSLECYLPKASVTQITISDECSLASVVHQAYNPAADDRRFRLSLQTQNQPLAFDQLRKQYPVRREFSSLTVDLSLLSNPMPMAYALTALGFSVTPL
jgi:erythronate-4-phosphate dehydrogenase